MKKILSVLLMISFVLSASGCSKFMDGASGSKLEISAYEKIQNMLVGLESYQADANVKYVSNKGSNEYKTLQQCRATGEYRVTVTGPEKVSGNVTVFDGKIISQFNPRISGKISVGTKESYERSEIFITSFIKNYLNSQEVTVTASTIGAGNDSEKSACTILEAVVPGDHPYLRSEKLWVDNKTLKPIQLVVYDPGGSERIVVTFSEFEYNVALDDSVFKAQ